MGILTRCIHSRAAFSHIWLGLRPVRREVGVRQFKYTRNGHILFIQSATLDLIHFLLLRQVGPFWKRGMWRTDYWTEKIGWHNFMVSCLNVWKVVKIRVSVFSKKQNKTIVLRQGQSVAATGMGRFDWEGCGSIRYSGCCPDNMQLSKEMPLTLCSQDRQCMRTLIVYKLSSVLFYFSLRGSVNSPRNPQRENVPSRPSSQCCAVTGI